MAQTTDDPLFFDDDAEDDGLPWLEPAEEEKAGWFSARVIAAAGVAFVILFAAFTWFLYTRFMESDEERIIVVAPELIEAPSEPYKVRPVDPGGEEVDNLDKLVLEGGRGEGEEDRLAAPAEEPIARDTPGGFVAAEPEAEADRAPAVETPTTEDTPAPLDVPVAEAPARATPAEAVASAPAEHPYLLQLGAFSTEERARIGWGIILTNVGDLLEGLEPDIERTQVAGKTVVRLRASGFETKSEATTRCASLKLVEQPCLVIERRR